MPPANDDFANAQVITGASGTVTGSNVGATLEAGEPAVDTPADGVTGSVTIWFKWTAPASGTVVFDTRGSGQPGTGPPESQLDTVLDAWVGSSLATLALIAANDDAFGVTSRVSFNAAAGTTYYLRVNGYHNGAGGEGDIVLNWAGAPPPPPPPTVTSFLPTHGLIGDFIDIFGSGFAVGVTSVHFGSIPAVFFFFSDGHIGAQVPAGATTAPISVTTSSGTGSSPSAFVVDELPSITDLSPMVLDPGCAFTIHGSGLATVEAVTLFPGAGANRNAPFRIISDAELLVQVPVDFLTTSAGDGVVVTVTNPFGEASFDPLYVYSVVPGQTYRLEREVPDPAHFPQFTAPGNGIGDLFQAKLFDFAGGLHGKSRYVVFGRRLTAPDEFGATAQLFSCDGQGFHLAEVIIGSPSALVGGCPVTGPDQLVAAYWDTHYWVGQVTTSGLPIIVPVGATGDSAVQPAPQVPLLVPVGLNRVLNVSGYDLGSGLPFCEVFTVDPVAGFVAVVSSSFLPDTVVGAWPIDAAHALVLRDDKKVQVVHVDPATHAITLGPTDDISGAGITAVAIAPTSSTDFWGIAYNNTGSVAFLDHFSIAGDVVTHARVPIGTSEDNRPMVLGSSPPRMIVLPASAAIGDVYPAHTGLGPLLLVTGAARDWIVDLTTGALNPTTLPPEAADIVADLADSDGAAVFFSGFADDTVRAWSADAFDSVMPACVPYSLVPIPLRQRQRDDGLTVGAARVSAGKNGPTSMQRSSRIGRNSYS